MEAITDLGHAQVMLMSPVWKSSSETRVVLTETPSCEAVFEDFLRYLYTGRIALDHATCIPLVSLADKYNVRDLQNAGLSFMARHVCSACRNGLLVSWHQFAFSAQHDRLDRLCTDFMLANFGTLAKRPDFNDMEPETLAFFLDRSDMVYSIRN